MSQSISPFSPVSSVSPHGQRKLLLLGLCLLASFAAAEEGPQQCSADGGTYLRLAEQAVEQRKFELADQRIVRAAAEGCYSAKLQVHLGEMLQEEGDNSAAAAQFEQAQARARTANTQALAIARYAQALAADVGPNPESLDLLQFARRAHGSPPAWMEALALQMDKQLLDVPFESERVTRSFSSNRMGRMSMAQIDPIQSSGERSADSSGAAISGADGGSNSRPVSRSLAFRTHFKRGSSELDAAERAKVLELAKALAGDELLGKRFRLVGHTDVTGSANTNQWLSVQRAETVYNLLIADRPELANRLTFDGKGAADLLYSNAQNALEHRLNRRVQVVLE